MSKTNIAYNELLKLGYEPFLLQSLSSKELLELYKLKLS